MSVVSKNSIKDFFNPKFIDPDYIDAFAREVLKVQSERVGSTSLRDFRAQARATSSWHIPRHFSYSSDNGIKGGGPDPATAEIQERVADILRGLKIFSAPRIPTISYHDIPSQNPLAASFQGYQLGFNRLFGYGNVIGVNCAPRTEQRGKVKDNGGEAVYTGVLPNGSLVFGTGPHCFSLFRNAVEKGEVEFFRTGVAISGSQFRSRDFWPFVGLLLATNLPDKGARLFTDWRNHPPSLEERRQILKGINFIDHNTRLEAKDIPSPLQDGSPRVLVADNHGNLKTSTTWGQLLEDGLKPGDRVNLAIKGKVVPATVTLHPFELPEGQTALSAGSGRSPFELKNPDRALVEIFRVGSSIAEHLKITATDLKNGITVGIESGQRQVKLHHKLSLLTNSLRP